MLSNFVAKVTKVTKVTTRSKQENVLIVRNQQRGCLSKPRRVDKPRFQFFFGLYGSITSYDKFGKNRKCWHNELIFWRILMRFKILVLRELYSVWMGDTKMFSYRNFIAKVTKATTRSKNESVAKCSKLKMRVSFRI